MMLLQSSKAQTYLTQRLANYLSEELKTEIFVEKIDVAFFNSLVLENFLVKDQQSDTLLFVEELSVGINYFNREFSEIELGEISLSKPIINIYSSDSISYNYSFIEEYFSTSDSDTSQSLLLNASELVIEEGRFSYHDYNYEDYEKFVNYDHVDASHLNVNAEAIQINDSSFTSQIKYLSVIEENGFKLEKLASNLTIKQGVMKFEELVVQTFGTDLSADYIMTYDSMADFSNFIDQVQIQSTFRNALVDVKDLSFFVPVFEGIKNKVYISGDVSGYVSNLKGRNLSFQVDKETFFKGRFDLRGLPDVEACYMYFKLEEFKTNAEGLRALPYPPFEEASYLNVPSNFNQLGDIRFKGEFTGFYNDFVAYGDFSTALGSITTDISLTENELEEFEYVGEIKSEEFELGRFIGFDNLKEIALNLRIDGKGLNVHDLEAEAVGQIDYLVLNDYRYKGLDLNGTFTNQKFTGDLSVNDENLSFDFKGLVDASQERAISKFSLDLYKSNLAKLNLFREYDTLTQLSFNADLNLAWSHIDDIEGRANFKEVRFKDSQLNHAIDSINLYATANQINRNIRLESDLVDAEITGKFKIYKLPQTIKHFIQEYIPNAESDQKEIEDQDFKYSFLLKNLKPATDVFIPELYVSPESELYGQIDTKSKNSKLILRSKRIDYLSYSIQNTSLELNSKPDSIFSNLTALTLNAGQLKLGKFSHTNSLSKGELNADFVWSKLNGESNDGNLSLYGRLYEYNKMDLALQNSYFKLKDSTWLFLDSNLISIDSNSVEFQNFSLSNGNQEFYLDGKVSEEDDTLNVLLKDLDLAYISTILPEGVLKLNGSANGTANFRNVYNDLSLTSDLRMKQLEINDTYIGEAKLISAWNPLNQSFDVTANLGENIENILTFKGTVFPLKEENSLDLVLSFRETPINLLKPYLTDILSDLEGSITGDVKITGEAYKPILKGGFNLNDAAFRIDYLNTTYRINDRIIVEPDFIGFNLIKIKDEQGKEAIATGTIFHNNYEGFNLDIGLNVDNFLALNTNSKQNDLYYGRAIVSGDANISGYSDQLILELNVKTEKGTDFNIPISDGVEISDSGFLTFTNSSDTTDQSEEEVDLSGIQMNFDLDISPDAKVQIIFDEQVGDIMRGNGVGNLKLEINTIGNFNIYGEYIVQQGDYLFTLQNVINKRFDIASGSRIAWDGDPYEADIDIKAIYNLRAALYDLMPEDTTSNLRRRVPVELELQMTNQLLSPDIDFDIRLPSSDDRIKRRLESIIYVNSNEKNRQELNQQVFGLLVLNRFLPPASGVATETGFDRGTPGVNNGYEFLSNQLSNWLSKMSDQFDIGVNYRPGDEITNDEFDFSVSTEVFNDRLVLDGNLGYTSSNQVAENQDNSNFIGEFSAEYKLSKDGRFRVRGFNRSTNNNLLQNISPYTQGVGLFYREEFSTLDELWKKYFHRRKDEND